MQPPARRLTVDFGVLDFQQPLHALLHGLEAVHAARQVARRQLARHLAHAVLDGQASQLLLQSVKSSRGRVEDHADMRTMVGKKRKLL